MAARSTYAGSRIACCVAIHGALPLWLCSPLSPVHAADSIRLGCDRPEPLEAALRPLASRALVTFTYETSLGAMQVCPVTSEPDVATALRQMLAGTGLIATKTGERSFDVHRAAVIQGPAMSTDLPAERVTIGGASVDSMTVSGERMPPDPIAPATVLYDSTSSYADVGFGTVGDVLARSSGRMSTLPEFVMGDGAQFADGRGLGIDFTSVRINQRWLAPTPTSAVSFDLNTIPLSFVERVEMLDEMQSARRGLRALGSTVEIELKKPPASPVVWLAAGSAAGGGIQLQAAAGLGIDRELWSAGLWVDYFDRDELPGRARDFWKDQNFSSYGGSDYRSRASWPGNVRSTTGAPLPGLPSSFAAVPTGTTGREPQVSDFLATAGQYRFDSLRGYCSILPAAKRRSVLLTVQGKSRNVTPFLELTGVWRDSEYHYNPPTLVDALTPASNYYNPFGQAVYASRLLLEIDARQVITDYRWWRLASGLRGHIGSWQWSAAVSRSEEFATRWANRALDEATVAAALASSDPDTALNVFQDGPVGSPELVASLISPPQAADFRSMGTEASADLRGPLVTLPAGDVMVSLNAQWRDERTVGMRTVATAQAALDVPLSNDTLDAHVDVRWDRLSDVGDIVTSGYALRWQPVRALELHASYASQFRAPSIYEMFGPSYSLRTLVSDRRRNGEVGMITASGGSSPDLSLVRGETAAFGFTVSPPDLSDLTVRGDYWSKQVHSRITTLPLTLMLEHEAEFAPLITRDAPTPADLAAGRPGVLRSIDLSMANVGDIETSGIDASISYRFPYDIEASLAATWTNEFLIQEVPGTAATNRLGVASPRGTIPRWRGAMSVKWNGKVVGAAVNARYAGSYEDMAGTRHTGRQLQPQTLFDLQVSMNLEALYPAAELTRGVRVTAGAQNIFDTSPQYSASGLDVGFDASLSDPRQRFIFLRLEKRFF